MRKPTWVSFCVRNIRWWIGQWDVWRWSRSEPQHFLSGRDGPSRAPHLEPSIFLGVREKKKSSFYTFYRNIVTGAVLSQCSQILHHTATNFTATGWKSFSHVEERRRAQTEEDGRNRLDLNHVCKQVSGPPQSCSVQQETETSHCSHSAVRTVENTKNCRSRSGSRRNQSAKTSADDPKLH